MFKMIDMDTIFGSMSKWPFAAFCLGFVMILGVIDYVTGYEISFSIFYLAPIAIGSWYGASSFGFSLALVSAVVWFTVDITSGHEYSYFSIPFWNAIVRFGFFAAIGAIGLAGVVVNDSIIMLVKLEKSYDKALGKRQSDRQISDIAKTRLKAVVLTTLTTVAGLLPTAYGFTGYDPMLAEMMLALCWGLIFGTLITLILVPCMYSLIKQFSFRRQEI